MKRRLKIFESGIYPQGNFNRERVKKIFGNVNEEVTGIFSHSSNWTEDKEAIELGKLDNVDLVDSGNKLLVYADIHFNEKGKDYYNDGVISGLSVEIPDDKFTKFAFLPRGINPAVTGAEFSKQAMYFEYQEIKEEKLKKEGEDKKMDRKEVLATLTKTEIEGQAERLNITVAERLAPKTPEQIEADVKAKLEKDYADKAKIQEFMKEHDKKIVPAFKPFFEKIVEESLKSEVNWEFNKKDMSLYDGLQEFMKKMPEFSGFKNYSDEIEFENQELKSNSLFKQGQKAVEGGN